MVTANIDREPTIRVANNEPSGQQNCCLSILFADTVCSDMELGQTGVSAAQSTIDVPVQLILTAIQKHSGTVIRAIGSSVIAEFSYPLLAVQAAVEMQRLTAANQADASDTQRGLRVGIYSLKDQRRGIDVFGRMVSAAAGITKQAISGQILISHEAYQEVSKQPGPHCSWSRAIKIDGVVENEDVFEARWHEPLLNIPSRYEVLSQAGKGGMGIVHKVLDRETGEIIALKILKPEIAGDPAMQENLRREVCLARKVTHKNVCRIHEFNRSNGAAFISMEFVEGESLLSMLNRVGPLPWNAVVPSALQICAGLREAHIQGIVHRDLKPANIMVDSAGGVKIMDFGIARLFQGTGELTGTMVGTPAYMAPEQLELRRVDARTDIYAVGLLLYEMVTGLQPFVGETPIAVALKHLREFPKRPREVMPTLPAHAEAVILKCLQKDPAKRFQSIDELTMALNRVMGRRPAASHWNSFVADFRRAGHDLQRDFQVGFKMVEEFLRRQDWRGLTPRPTKGSIAAGLGTACLLVGLIVYSVNASRKSHMTGSALTESARIAADQNSKSPLSEAIAPVRVSTSTAITSFDVDLGMISGRTPEKNLPPARAKLVAPSRSLVLQSESKVMRTPLNVKVQPAAHILTSSAPMAQPAIVPSLSTAAANDEINSKAGAAGRDLSASHEAAAPTEPAKEQIAADVRTPPLALQALYLEVGSFKDLTWADHAVDKLTQLGFHSVAVHKNLLWMQSYQVRVGPYADQKDLEDARENLASQGFKPHPVK